MFFLGYICIAIAAVAQATFLPTILHTVPTTTSSINDSPANTMQLLKFPTRKANLYTAIVNLVAVPLHWIYPLHSDWTRERVWHFIIPVLGSIPCYAVWTYTSLHPGTHSISYMSMYGMAFLGQLLLVSQPVLLSYRSATLYGAAEQAVCTSIAVAALSIASIIAPQMYPNSDAPYYLKGFMATVALRAGGIVCYLTIPLCLYFEAQRRKVKTGHSLPVQAVVDAGRSEAETKEAVAVQVSGPDGV